MQNHEMSLYSGFESLRPMRILPYLEAATKMRNTVQMFCDGSPEEGVSRVVVGGSGRDRQSAAST